MTIKLERRILSMPATPLRLCRSRRDDQGDDKPGDPPEGKAGDDKPADDKPDAKETKGVSIEGYAAVFHSEQDPGTEYELYSDRHLRVLERIATGAFARAIREQDDVRALYNHDPSMVLGRTQSGTCQLSEDARGLRYRVDLPDTQTGRDVAALVGRGDLSGSSFGFEVEQESWRESEEEGGRRVAIRTVESVRLLDVGPVTYPAYASTSSSQARQGGVRTITSAIRSTDSADEARASYERWKSSQMPIEARLAAVRARVAEVCAAC